MDVGVWVLIREERDGKSSEEAVGGGGRVREGKLS